MKINEAIMTLEGMKKQYKTPAIIDVLDMAIEALEHDKWIPFKDEEGLNVLQKPIPEDGQEILITVSKKGHEPVQKDTFIIDCGECYLDSGYDLVSEAVAWRPLPKPCEVNNDKE